jgi:hypothetical protein
MTKLLKPQPTLSTLEVAERLKVPHKDFIKSIKRNAEALAFLGPLEFRQRENGRGMHPTSYALLNADQLRFIMSTRKDVKKAWQQELLITVLEDRGTGSPEIMFSGDIALPESDLPGDIAPPENTFSGGLVAEVEVLRARVNRLEKILGVQ